MYFFSHHIGLPHLPFLTSTSVTLYIYILLTFIQDEAMEKLTRKVLELSKTTTAEQPPIKDVLTVAAPPPPAEEKQKKGGCC